MDSLPEELIDRISSLLDRAELKTTLLVSRRFQRAAERHSGAFASFELTDGNHGRFLQLFSGYRYGFLREILFRTSLPVLHSDDYTGAPLSLREDEVDLAAQTEAFSTQIRALFTTLETIESKVVGRMNFGRRIALTVFGPCRPTSANVPYTRRFSSWRVRLSPSMVLPAIRIVKSLTVQDGGELDLLGHLDEKQTVAMLSVEVLPQLMSRLPQLEEVYCRLGGDEWRPRFEHQATRYALQDWPGPRRDARLELGQLLLNQGSGSNLPPPTLQRASLDFLSPDEQLDSIDQREPLPDLVSPLTHDPFSRGLGCFSQALHHFKLSAVIDHTLFSLPHEWPHLESLEICFHASTPQGAWYFDAPPGYAHHAANDPLVREGTSYYPPFTPSQEDRRRHGEVIHEADMRGEYGTCMLRITPNAQRITPFLSAFAQAAAERMPKLRKAMIWCPLRWEPWDLDVEDDDYEGDDGEPQSVALAWGIIYAAPGVKTGGLMEDAEWDASCAVRQLWWKVGDWRPAEELHQAFLRIEEDQHGPDVCEYWGDLSFTVRGLVERGLFTEFSEFED